jgi:hypothetical protein
MKDIAPWLSMAIYPLPMFFVAVIGCILALVKMRRLGSAGILLVLGCGTFAALSVVVLAVRIYLFEEMRSGNLPPNRYGMISGVVSMAGNVGNAIGLALLVAGALVGRRAPQERPERAATGRRGYEED